MTSLASQNLTREPPRQLTPEELRQRWQAAYPEAAGPGQDTESGAVIYSQEPDPRIGEIPHLLDPETVRRENAEREARLAAMTPAERQAREDLRTLVRDELRRA